MNKIRWFCKQRCESLWHCWDAERYIVFNVGSGQTHQLNQFATDILILLDNQSVESEKIVEQVGRLYENFELDPRIAAYLQETLALLDSIGLIEPEVM